MNQNLPGRITDWKIKDSSIIRQQRNDNTEPRPTNEPIGSVGIYALMNNLSRARPGKGASRRRRRWRIRHHFHHVINYFAASCLMANNRCERLKEGESEREDGMPKSSAFHRREGPVNCVFRSCCERQLHFSPAQHRFKAHSHRTFHSFLPSVSRSCLHFLRHNNNAHAK